jgi:hypothetical protein
MDDNNRFLLDADVLLDLDRPDWIDLLSSLSWLLLKATFRGLLRRAATVAVAVDESKPLNGIRGVTLVL